MTITTVNGINFYYEIYGNNKGQPIVFIPGFGANHISWQTIIAEYTDNYQVILIDNRGSGASDSPDAPYTIDMMAADIQQLCIKLSLEPCHFIGSSMGGAIVQTIVHQYPQITRSVIIANCTTRLDIRFALFAKGIAKVLQNISLEAAVEMFLGWIYSSRFLNQKGVIESLMEASLTNPYPMTEVGFRNQLHALLQFNSAKWISQIKVPCLVLGSELDAIAAEAEVKLMATQIPNAHYHCFRHVGHLPFIESPTDFNTVIKQFIAANSK